MAFAAFLRPCNLLLDAMRGPESSITRGCNSRPVTMPCKSFRLFDLPPEIRNEIYKFVVSPSLSIIINDDLYGSFKRWVRTTPYSTTAHKWISDDAGRATLSYRSNFLRSCRKIHSEARGLCYASDKYLLCITERHLTPRRLDRLIHLFVQRMGSYGSIASIRLKPSQHLY